MRLCSSLRQVRRRLEARGFRVWQPRRGPVVREMETMGRPKFLGNPHVSMPCSLTPAGLQTHQAVTVRQHGPRTHHDEGSSREVISGLNGTASTLAVYASPRGSPQRTQDSLLAAGQALPDGIRTRRVPTKRFRDVAYITSSFPKLAWRRMRPLVCGFY